jgi:hypothetical protein
MTAASTTSSTGDDITQVTPRKPSSKQPSSAPVYNLSKAQSNASHNSMELDLAVETARSLLWRLTWEAVQQAASFSGMWSHFEIGLKKNGGVEMVQRFRG